MDEEKLVRLIRDDNNVLTCEIKEDGWWKHWENSKFWMNHLNNSSPDDFRGFAGNNGFFCFQLALKEGYTNVV